MCIRVLHLKIFFSFATLKVRVFGSQDNSFERTHWKKILRGASIDFKITLMRHLSELIVRTLLSRDQNSYQIIVHCVTRRRSVSTVREIRWGISVPFIPEGRFCNFVFRSCRAEGKSWFASGGVNIYILGKKPMATNFGRFTSNSGLVHRLG